MSIIRSLFDRGMVDLLIRRQLIVAERFMNRQYAKSTDIRTFDMDIVQFSVENNLYLDAHGLFSGSLLALLNSLNYGLNAFCPYQLTFCESRYINKQLYIDKDEQCIINLANDLDIDASGDKEQILDRILDFIHEYDYDDENYVIAGRLARRR